MPKSDKSQAKRGKKTAARGKGSLKDLSADAAKVKGGKRTNVKDAHDKYANIEVSYG